MDLNHFLILSQYMHNFLFHFLFIFEMNMIDLFGNVLQNQGSAHFLGAEWGTGNLKDGRHTQPG
jgi:hypothetical protein